MDVSGDPLHYFHANPTVDDLIAQQRKEPMREPRILLDDFCQRTSQSNCSWPPFGCGAGITRPIAPT
jgi:hypothetical protein